MRLFFFCLKFQIVCIQIFGESYSIGEGNGNPLQYSCLENPKDGGARWAAVYGVTQSRTRLKRLSSSSILFVDSWTVTLLCFVSLWILWFVCVCLCMCSVVSDSETPWTVACQAPLSMEFSRQEYWSRLPFPTPGDLPNPGINQLYLNKRALL